MDRVAGVGAEMNAQLSLCFGSMGLVSIVTLVVVTRILVRTMDAQKTVRLQEEARQRVEAEELAAWREQQRTFRPSPSRGYVTPEKRQEYEELKQRQEAKRLLSDSKHALRRVRDWSESSGEIIDPNGHAIVSLGRDGKLYNMDELAEHMGKIFRSGDPKFNKMMAEVYVQFHTYPTNLTPISLSDSEIAECSEYNAIGRGLALQAGYGQSSVGSSHHAVIHQVGETCNGLPRR